MKKIKLISAISGILLLALHNNPLQAEQVQLYDQPPSAAEMGRLLFGEQPKAAGGMKMRSIDFTRKTPKIASNDEIVKSAKTELTSIGLPIKFAYNSDEILPESIPFLEEVGKMLTMEDFADKRLFIEGHTDSVGSDSYNLMLSQRRARAVGQYLMRSYGVGSKRLFARGVGERKPLPGYSPEDEANRRVQFYSAN